MSPWFLLANSFYYLGWVTTNHYVVGHILRDNSPCGNYGILADGYARTDDGTDADPRILFDGNFSEMEKVVPVVQVVIYRHNLNLGANKHVVFYHYTPRREDCGSFVDYDVSA